MSDSEPPDPLRQLSDDLDQARLRADPANAPGRGDITTGGNALGFGLRIGIELVAALIVGVGIGWLADRYIGTRPWGILLGFFLGSAAGIINVFRAVQNMGGGGPGAGRRG